MASLFYCGNDAPVVKTTGGRLRGFTYRGIHHFLGVPYGTAKRFFSPAQAKWSGVKDAFVRGDGCLTTAMGKPRRDYVPLLQGTIPSTESEDCLNLNIWTPSIDRGSKLPVIVWIPGGGFHAGNANDTVATDGFNISAYGDVVFVSVNHRIALLGFLDLSPFDETRYENTANLGLEDLVAALKWIQENISAFGGDPSNVTLMGHSGGGCKQWALMQTPAADGLFHKCVMESAVSANMVFPKKEHNGYDIVHKILEKLGLSDSDVAELETMDYRKLLEGYMSAYSEESAAYMKDGIYRYVGRTVLPNNYYYGYPFDYGLRPEAYKISCIIGSALGESGWHWDIINNKTRWSDVERMEKLHSVYGKYTSKILSCWAKAYPGKDPLDLIYYETMFRTQIIHWCEMKEQFGAPCWNYMFALESPIFGGLPAHHGSEIPFLLHNVERMPAAQIPEISEKVEKELSGALINFAYRGDPNDEGHAEWPQWTKELQATMIFDVDTRLGIGYDSKLLELHNKVVPWRRFPI